MTETSHAPPSRLDDPTFDRAERVMFNRVAPKHPSDTSSQQMTQCGERWRARIFSRSSSHPCWSPLDRWLLQNTTLDLNHCQHLPTLSRSHSSSAESVSCVCTSECEWLHTNKLTTVKSFSTHYFGACILFLSFTMSLTVRRWNVEWNRKVYNAVCVWCRCVRACAHVCVGKPL